MATYTIDTAAAIHELTQSGMPEQQATAVVRTFAESQEELATRGDIREVKSEIEALETRIKLWLFKALSILAAAVVTLSKLLDYILPGLFG